MKEKDFDKIFGRIKEQTGINFTTDKGLEWVKMELLCLMGEGKLKTCEYTSLVNSLYGERK